jgi:hypothetical protein
MPDLRRLREVIKPSNTNAGDGMLVSITIEFWF